jgi:hypothetical protein
MFEIEDISSWPEDLVVFLADKGAVFQQYWNRSSAIVFMEPIDRFQARNEFVYEFEIAKAEISKLISEIEFSCYHVSRLLPAEIENIRSFGLQVLSEKSALARIEAAHQSNALSKDTAQLLANNHLCNDPGRCNELWFSCGVSILKYESAIKDLMNRWGGEAISDFFFEDQLIREELLRIGLPTIINFKVPIGKAHFTGNIAEIIVRAYLDMGSGTERIDGAEGSIDQDISANDIVRIITIEDPDFLTLTDYQNWDSKI